MARWLILGCLFVVGIGLMIRLLGSTGETTASKRPDPVAAAPKSRPAPPPEVQKLLSRLMEDDTLSPPPPDAPREVRIQYEETIKDISVGRDPLLKSQEDKSKLTKELFQRLEARKTVAKERKVQLREQKSKQAKEKAAQKRAEDAARREDRQTRRETLFGPQPKPEPLVPRQDLGPPVIFDENENPGNTQPPPALPE